MDVTRWGIAACVLSLALLCSCEKPRPISQRQPHTEFSGRPRTRSEAAREGQRVGKEPLTPPGRRKTEPTRTSGCFVSFAGDGTLIDCTFPHRCPALLAATVAAGEGLSLVPAGDGSYNLRGRRTTPPLDPLAGTTLTFDGKEGGLKSAEPGDDEGRCEVRSDQDGRLANGHSVEFSGVSLRRLF